ncbi:hypothetical protein L291_0647 [Acinetobacter guillouiae MSP4-18]|nr:hypothetical protein L291_0647 [Acinetobacter guillouiae MSP4-18]
MIQYLKCIFGFHRLIDTHYCNDGKLKVCRHCLKVINEYSNTV